MPFLAIEFFLLKTAIERTVAAVAIAIFSYCFFLLKVMAAFCLKGGRFFPLFFHHFLLRQIATMVTAMTLWWPLYVFKVAAFLPFFLSFFVEGKHCNNSGCLFLAVAALCLHSGRFLPQRRPLFLPFSFPSFFVEAKHCNNGGCWIGLIQLI
jgi:hypothetical protein